MAGTRLRLGFDADFDRSAPGTRAHTRERIGLSLEQASGRLRTPIIMLTANALPEHVEQAPAAGADHHIAKPLKAAELLDALCALGEAPRRGGGQRRRLITTAEPT